MKLVEIRSRIQKHRGAVFFKVKGSEKTFVVKVYPEFEEQATIIRRAIESVLEEAQSHDSR